MFVAISWQGACGYYVDENNMPPGLDFWDYVREWTEEQRNSALIAPTLQQLKDRLPDVTQWEEATDLDGQ